MILLLNYRRFLLLTQVDALEWHSQSPLSFRDILLHRRVSVGREGRLDCCHLISLLGVG